MLIDNKDYLKELQIEAESISFDKFKNKSFLITGASGMICSF